MAGRRVRSPVAQSGISDMEVQGSVPSGTPAIWVTLKEAATYTIHGITFTRGVRMKLPAEQRPLFDKSPWFTVQDA